MGLPDPGVQPDTDWRWVAHAAWSHAQLALNRIGQLEERLELLEQHRHRNAFSEPTYIHLDEHERET